jgi:hypothetical protein
MLVLDAFKDHLTPEVKSAIHALNTALVVIPGGINLKQLYSEWLLAGDHILTPGKIEKPSVALLCQWIKT